MELLGTTAINLLAMLVTLGILVTIHEYGHFIIARACKVKVERFSVGFGKPLLSWRGKPASAGEQGTEYVVGALPLGGYVKMLGEQDDIDDPQLRAQAFSHKPLSQRSAIVAAGPVANFLLAILLYWGLFLGGVSGLAPVIGLVEEGSVAASAGLETGQEIIAVDGRPTETWQDVRIALLDRLGESGAISLELRGPDSSLTRQLSLPIQNWHSDTDQPDLLGSLGFAPYHLSMQMPPRLNEVLADGRAAAAGLRPDDLVIAVNGQQISTWREFLREIQTHPEQDLQLLVDRDGSQIALDLRPALRLDEAGQPLTNASGERLGYIGASVVVPPLPAWMERTVSYSLVGALSTAAAETLDNSLFVLDSIGKMIMGNISVKNLSGPLTIAQVAGETASSGLEYYVGFLALLSISLGVLNLLPIPVLDGGHLFYYAVEAIIRRPVPERIQAIGMQLGMMLVACIMILALFNDVNRLF